MSQRRDLPVQPCADADQHLGTDDVEAALKEVEPDSEARQNQKRWNAAAGQRPVVDLHHVERAGQRQHVDHPGNQKQKQHYAAEAAGELGEIAAFRRRQLFGLGHGLQHSVHKEERRWRQMVESASIALTLEVEVRIGQGVLTFDFNPEVGAAAIDVTLPTDEVVAVFKADGQLARSRSTTTVQDGKALIQSRSGVCVDAAEVDDDRRVRTHGWYRHRQLPSSGT